jgi:hypothetical protein
MRNGRNWRKFPQELMLRDYLPVRASSAGGRLEPAIDREMGRKSKLEIRKQPIRSALVQLARPMAMVATHGQG